MRRIFLYSILFISLGFNIYCGFDYYQNVQSKRTAVAFIKNWNIKEVNANQGNDFLFKATYLMRPEYKQSKRYYFISIWNTLCKPCIKEMPLLDTLADTINRADVGYLFVTENGENMITQFRKKHGITSRNFLFINDADMYISYVLNTLQLKTRQYPIQLVINNQGEILFNQTGTFESSHDSTLIKVFQDLK